jgi:hypothetical protein
MYFFEVKQILFGIISGKIVFLVVESDTCRVFRPALIGYGLQQDLALIDDDVVLDVGIFFVFNFKIVDGESLDG